MGVAAAALGEMESASVSVSLKSHYASVGRSVAAVAAVATLQMRRDGAAGPGLRSVASPTPPVTYTAIRDEAFIGDSFPLCPGVPNVQCFLFTSHP